MNSATLIMLIVILAAASLATASIIRARRCRKDGAGTSSGTSGSATTCQGCALSPFCRKRQ